MKEFSLTLLILISFAGTFFAQAPDTLWTKTYGGSDDDWGYSIQQTNDGGYIIAGTTESFGAASGDVWLIKTDTNGDTLWTKTFGDTAHDAGYSVQQTTDGGYIITGATESFGAGSADVWLIKTDANGDSLWTKTFGESGFDEGWSVQQTSDGGYIITGHLSASLWVIKTDASGDSLWTRTYYRSTLNGGYSVQQTTDGGYIIAGFFECFILWEPCYSFTWLLKTDVIGDTLWTKAFGIPATFSYSYGYSVQETVDGGYIIAGSGQDGSLIKTDANGETQWTNNIIGTGYFAHQTTDGGYIITGLNWGSSNDVGLIKTDANGDTIWTKTFGGSGDDEGRSVRRTTDGGYIIAGGTNSFGAGGGDVWLIRVASDITSIDENLHAFSNNYQLFQNYPNPFNPVTTIEFSLPKPGFVTLKAYNILGQEISTLVSEKLSAGIHKYYWNANDLTSGVYFYKIETDRHSLMKKALLIK
ncbi:MAG: hypothetical protein CV087_08895 [Candidatus Brocadia sp. WS118]|nr:MAG: hypothetical protein CV087_08895 [Candidatus Brocadia sp. WS118]